MHTKPVDDFAVVHMTDEMVTTPGAFVLPRLSSRWCAGRGLVPSAGSIAWF
jgi:hypothetical protein